MKILVTGATGVMGKMLIAALHAKGHAIRALVLPDDPFAASIKPITKELFYADITSRDALAGVCEGVDTVYHCASVIIASDPGIFISVNVEGTTHLLAEALNSAVKHFIYISSASVVYPRPNHYSRSKQHAERLVQSAGLPYTIIRPTLVYDIEKGGMEFDLFLEYLNKFPIVPFIGKGTCIKRPVFCQSIIDGLVKLCNNLNCIGKIYNFSGGEPITLKEFALLCLELSGSPQKPIISLPLWLCIAIVHLLKLFSKKPALTWQTITSFTQDANLDPHDAVRDIGYSPGTLSEQLPSCFPRFFGKLNN